MSNLLSIKNLTTNFNTVDGNFNAVKGISFDLKKGESIAIVGESGSGKSVSALSILQLNPTPQSKITNGEIKPGGIRAGIIRADYVLIYKNRKLAVIEAKSDKLNVSDGVSQAKDYAQKLKILTSYSTNGHKIYEINYSKNEKGEMFIISESEVDKFPSPEELWIKTFK